MIYVFLATGFEDIEALAPIDIMRRAGLEVQTVSITGEDIVISAHGVGIVADTRIEAIDFADAEMIVLPGGLPGSLNLDACVPLREGILAQFRSGKPIAAICAAPQVFGHLGILAGKNATCYPGCECHLEGANYTASLVEVDGTIITGKGPAAAFEFGYTLVDYLLGAGAADGLREGMMYNFLLA